MKRFTAKTAKSEIVVHELPDGDGAVSRTVTHPTEMAVPRHLLGTEFIIGSVAANRILPGGPGQQPDVDYSCWGFHASQTHPVALKATVPTNAQALILLDPFTEETGATAFLSGNQIEPRCSCESDRFFERCERMPGEPGDVAPSSGAAWRSATPDTSQQDRGAILIQYPPEWVKPLEDAPAAPQVCFVDAAGAEIRRLLVLNCPYPEGLDTAEAGNTEGRL